MMLYPKNMSEPYCEPYHESHALVTPPQAAEMDRARRSGLIAVRRIIAKGLIRAGYAIAPRSPTPVSRQTSG